MQFFNKTQIDFVSKRMTFFYVTIVLTIIGLTSLFVSPPEFGIDFTGGSEVAVAFEKTISTEDLRKAAANANIGGIEIKSFGEDNQFLMRIGTGDDYSDKLKETLIAKFPNNKMTVLKVDKIGPKVGDEMRTQALFAVILASIGILMYIAFRFEFRFGVAAIVALIHDLVLTFTTLVLLNNLGLFNLEVDASILAGILTVIGYSINDTVIVFDRVRENLELHKGMDLPKLVNMSINETLSRTVNTVGTTLMVLLVIALLGGPVLFGFAFTMVLGIIFGTYSSVYIASSFVIWYSENYYHKNEGKLKLSKS